MSLLREGLGSLKDSYDGIKEVIQESFSSKQGSSNTQAKSDKAQTESSIVTMTNRPFTNVMVQKNSSNLLKLLSLINKLKEDYVPVGMDMNFEISNDMDHDLRVSFIGSQNFHIDVELLSSQFIWDTDKGKDTMELFLYHTVSQQIVAKIGALQTQEANYPHFVSENMVGTHFTSATDFIEILHINENRFIKFAQALNLASLYPVELKQFIKNSIRMQSLSQVGYDIFPTFEQKDEKMIIEAYNKIVEKYNLAHVDVSHITYTNANAEVKPVFIQLKFATKNGTSMLNVPLLPNISNRNNYMDAVIAGLIQQIDKFSVEKAMKKVTYDSATVDEDVIRSRLENDLNDYQALKKYLEK